MSYEFVTMFQLDDWTLMHYNFMPPLNKHSFSFCSEFLCRPPVGWGSTYCFTDVSVGVGVHVTPIIKGTNAQIFFGRHIFCSPGHFDFCYDLDFCSQGQAVRAFFIKMGFSLILSKVQGGFWSSVSESFIDRWHMTWLLLTFSWPTFASTV